MLLFYEDEPDSTRVKLPEAVCDQGMDPLQQYGPYAFIPYLTVPRLYTPSTSSTPPATEEPLALNNTSTWTYCGPVLAPSSPALPSSFHTWSALTFSHPSVLLNRLLPLLSFLQSFLSAAGAGHYWLTIRATKPTNEYDTPRWHTDENFFDNPLGQGSSHPNSQSKQRFWKLATTLLGPPTLFLEDNDSALDVLRFTKAQERFKNDHPCTSTRCLGCSTYADSVRSSLSSTLASEHIVSSKSGEVAFFRLGDEEGAVHSEPRCDVDRIFVNVVPGGEKELKDLMGRWGMEFPRAWCFGVPVGFVRSDESEAFGGVCAGTDGTDVFDVEEELYTTKSTMSVNLSEACGAWLKKQGFHVAKLFGHTKAGAGALGT